MYASLPVHHSVFVFLYIRYIVCIVFTYITLCHGLLAADPPPNLNQSTIDI